MAVFKVVQPKKKKGENSAKLSPEPWPVTVSVPVSEKMAMAAHVGDKCEICVRGTVKSARSSKGDTYEEGSRVELLLSEVEMSEGSDDLEELADV